MEESQKQIPANFEELIAAVKRYFLLQKELFKIDGISKLSQLLSAIVVAVLCVIFAANALFFFFFALSFGLAPYVGGESNGFLIVGALYLVLLLILFLLRKSLVLNPLVRLLSGIFLTDNEDA